LQLANGVGIAITFSVVSDIWKGYSSDIFLE